MKLSIIVPVYNVEDYLSQCLESCIHQNMSASEYEVIVVNDGSPDNSLAIINDYATRYDNIVVISKENGGLSSARNAGLKIAKGDYIWFVDSDDWIEKNSIKLITDHLSSEPDLVVLNTCLNAENNQTDIIRNLSQQKVYSGSEVYNKGYIYPYSGAPFYVLKKQLLYSYNIHFEEGIYFEDLVFAPEVLSLAKTCVVIKQPLYHYRIRANSITTSNISEKKIQDMLSVMDFQNHFLLKQSDCDKKIMADSICKTANSLFRRFIMKIEKANRIIWYKSLREKNYWYSSVKKSKSFKNYIYYFIFRGIFLVQNNLL